MEEVKEVVTFIKAIDRSYFDSFINQGQVCMNTIKWFREYEAVDSNIGDKFEGAQLVCGEGFTVSFADPIESHTSEKELQRQMSTRDWTVLGKGIDLRLVDKSANANVLSLFALTTDLIDKQTGKINLPQKFIDEFDSHRFVIFIFPMTFIEMIESAISGFGKKPKHGLINYYKLNDEFQNNLSYFHKPETYSYQNEFRIIFDDSEAERRIFNIGPLEEICIEIDINLPYFIELVDNNHFRISSSKVKI